MLVEIDQKDLLKLQRKLKTLTKSKRGITDAKMLKEAVKPAYDKMKDLVPVGKRKFGQGTYERGGTTKRDIRVRVVVDKAFETKALVGVDGRSGKVGWRAHFQEYGPGNHSKRRGWKDTGRRWKFTPFKRPAEAATKDIVIARLAKLVEGAIKVEFET